MEAVGSHSFRKEADAARHLDASNVLKQLKGDAKNNADGSFPDDEHFQVASRISEELDDHRGLAWYYKVAKCFYVTLGSYHDIEVVLSETKYKRAEGRSINRQARILPEPSKGSPNRKV